MESLVIDPGESTSLRLGLNLKGRYGPQRLACMADQDDGRTWVFEMEVTIYSRAHFSQSVIHFGMVDPSSEHERAGELHFHAPTETDLPTVDQLVVNSQRVVLAAKEPETERAPDGIWVRKVPFVARLRSPDAAGAGETILSARYTHAGEGKSADVGLDWYVRHPVVARPAQVYYGPRERDSGQPVERSVVLTRADGQPLQIRSAKPDREGITCRADTRPDGSCLLTVIYEAAKAGDFLSGSVAVSTDHPAQPTLNLPVAVAPR